MTLHGLSLLSQDICNVLLSPKHTDIEEVTSEMPGRCSKIEQNIPTWAAYNSVVSLKTLPKTKVGVLPLVPAPTHGMVSFLTVLKQAQHINTIVLGPNRGQHGQHSILHLKQAKY